MVDLEKRGLSKRDRAVLAIEREWFKHPGAKVTTIRLRTGLTETRYYQILNALLDDPRAMAHDPMPVRRLVRLRERRRAVRRGRVSGQTPGTRTP